MFIEQPWQIVMIGPREEAFPKLGHLLAVPQYDRILADEIDTADMAVEIDADAWPVKARRDLLDMGRFARAMIAGDHDPAVIGKAGQDCECGLAVEEIVL